MRNIAGLALLTLLLAAGAGCGPSVNVRDVSASRAIKNYASVLDQSGSLSDRTQQWLRRHDYTRSFQSNPVQFLAQLQEQVHGKVDREEVFALAELFHQTARRQELTNKKVALEMHLGCAQHAYYYLFDDCFADATSQYDPRFRQACDLYNSSLAKIIRLSQARQLIGRDRMERVDILDKQIEIEVVRKDFPWAGDEFGEILFAADYQVRGLENHYETFGLGVPLIVRRKADGRTQEEERHFPKATCFPCTAFLRMDGHLNDHDKMCRKASLELFDPLRTQVIEVAGKPVPLESDLTTPLGYYLSRAKLDGIASFGLFRPDSVDPRTGLYFAEPYQPGKIPVVLVHGLWSSPLTWMPMFNDLRGDPLLRKHFQFWFFLYPTGSPFLHSGSKLRQSLDDAIASYDPEGKDPALRDMVLIGHSMGGLLSKTIVQSSGDEIWNRVAVKPFAALAGDAAQKQAIRQVMFFDAQPFVKRVVFVATPHHGSPLSKEPLGRVANALVAVPNSVLNVYRTMTQDNPSVFRDNGRRGLPTSIENLSPDSPVIQTLATLPINDRVAFHSIMGQLRPGDPQKNGDGVVPYTSSHLDGAESELIIRSDHNVHEHPLAVQEVERILREHLKDYRKARTVIQAGHAENARPAREPVAVVD